MTIFRPLAILFLSVGLLACKSNKLYAQQQTGENKTIKLDATIHYPQEKHLAHVKQLTFGGDNAEAYFSFDDGKIVFQTKNRAWGSYCDQIYLFPFKDGNMKNRVPKLMSNGLGRTTCSYFMPGDTTILYASTRAVGAACPPEPAKRTDGKYVWPIYAGFDIYIANIQGEVIDTLIKSPGYNAEATVSPQGDKIVFSSNHAGTRGFNFNLYKIDVDGTHLERITYDNTFDAFPMFSYDGKKLIFSSSRNNHNQHGINLFIADWVK